MKKVSQILLTIVPLFFNVIQPIYAEETPVVEEIEEEIVEEQEENIEEEVVVEEVDEENCIESVKLLERARYDTGAYFLVTFNEEIENPKIHIAGATKKTITEYARFEDSYRFDGVFDLGEYYLDSIEYTKNGETYQISYAEDEELSFIIEAENDFEISNESGVQYAHLTLQDLRKKFPNGKYWNHVGMSKNNQDGYTNYQCDPVKHVNADKTCNWFVYNGFAYSAQCMGFAEKCAYDATGYNPRFNANGWYTSFSSSSLNTLKAGDVVRYLNDGHSIFIIGVNGEEVTYADCNYGHICIIRWGMKTTKSQIRQTFTNVRVAPYEIPNTYSASMFATDKTEYTVGDIVRIHWKLATFADSYQLQITGPTEKTVFDLEEIGSYTFTNTLPGTYTATLNAYRSNGTLLESKSVNFNVNTGLENGVYQIYSKLNTNKFIKNSNDQLYLMDSSQNFEITKLTNGNYKILDVETNKYICADSNKVMESAAYDEWKISNEGDNSFSIQNCYSGLYLHVDSNDTEITVQEKNNTANQQWIFKKKYDSIEPMNVDFIYLKKGETYNLSNVDSAALDVVWTTQDIRIAKVSPTVLVTAVKDGVTTITSRTIYGKRDICKVVVDEGIYAEVLGYSLSLSGDIGINYHLYVPNSVAQDKNTRMEFTTSKGKQVVPISEAKKEGNKYTFTCHVSAKEMEDTVVGKIYTSDGAGYDFPYSVKEYVDYIQTHEDKFSKRIEHIVDSMIQYGKYTQKYFGYNTDNLANLKNLTEISFDKYQTKVAENSNFVGARLVLKSKPSLKLYFSKDDNYYVDESLVNATTEGKYKVVTINDIDGFYRMYTISSSNETIKYSIASYASLAMESSNLDLKNMMISMCIFANSLQ